MTAQQILTRIDEIVCPAEMRVLVEATVGKLRDAGLEREALSALKDRADTASCWVRARLLESLGEPEAAAVQYERVVDSNGLEIPDVLLQRARLAMRAGNPARCFRLLQLALEMHPDYPLLLRAEALASKMRAAVNFLRRARIALLGGPTTTFLKSVLNLLLLRDRIDGEFYEGDFGAYRQEILDSASGLYRFAPDLVVVLLSWRDAGLADLEADPSAAVEAVASGITSLWEELAARHRCHVFQTAFDLPGSDPYHALSGLLPNGRARLLREINRVLLDRAPEFVVLMDTERIASSHGVKWEDPMQWSASKMHPSPEALPLLGEHLASLVRATLGLNRKVLAVDLDNTLWGGIIGEDGLGGIKLGPPCASGERYQELQRYLRSLKDRGVLLAVASKNNPDDARRVFERHESCILKLEDFAAFEVNWDDKVRNLRRVASDLNLGLDSFVFLDDNPVERSLVRRELPEVIVPEVTGDPSESIASLERGLYFQAIRLTEEDRNRHASYRVISARKALRGSAGSLEEWLAGLHMEMEWGPVDAQTCARVTQLFNKTNQFNLTTKRYTEEQVMKMFSSDRFWFHWYRLRDRFTDHGLVGVVLIERQPGLTWRLDSWLMSCRVIGRNLEYLMFNTFLEAGREEGVMRIQAGYIPTAKNGIVSGLLSNCGFQLAESGDFQLDVRQAKLMPAGHFCCRSLASAAGAR